MLSFREVHANDSASSAASFFGAPAFYRPGAIMLGGGTQPPTGNPSSPDADSSTQFYLASCPANLRVGQAVYVTGPAMVDVADCQSPELVIGIVTGKRSATLAIVQTSGEIVLGLSGLSPGVSYFLGGNGELSAPPLDGVLYVQRVGVATTATRLFLQLDRHVVRREPS